MKKKCRPLWLLVTAASIAVAMAPLANAQSYPSRPVTLIVPFSPGGGTDTTARIIAEPLSKRLGQPVLVENKPGAGAALGTNFVVKAKPDGYTLLYGANDALTILSAVKPNLPYRIPDDLVFLNRIVTTPFTISVNSQVPLNSWEELVVYAKANPGKLNYGTAGNGGGAHLAAILLERSAGISMTHVPYKGVGDVLPALVGGTVDIGIVSPSAINPHVAGGKAKVLLQTGEQRHRLLPNVPTTRDIGMKDAVVYAWYGIFAPVGVPADIADRLRREIGLVLQDPDVIARLDKIGWTTAPLEGDAFRSATVDELEAWKRIAKEANVVVTD